MTGKIKMKDLQSVFFAITNICNCNCLTCDIGTSKGMNNSESFFLENLNFGVQEYASQELMQRIFEQLNETGSQLYVTGGEPLISPLFKEFLEIFHHYSGRIDLVTNGSFLQSYVEEIVTSSVASINVSLDGIQSTHDNIRGISGLYEKVVRGIINLRKCQYAHKSRQKLNLNFTISSLNYTQISDYAGMALELGVDRVDFLHPQYVSTIASGIHNREYPEMQVGTRMFNDSQIYNIPVSNLQRIIDKTKSEFGNFVLFFPDLTHDQLDIYYEDDVKFPIQNECSIPYKGFEIIQNGDCIIGTPCVPYKIGNIMKDSVKDIWLGERIEKFRRILREKQKFPICTKCCAYYY